MPRDFDCDLGNRIYGAIMHERGYIEYCVSIQLASIPMRIHKAPNELPVSEYEDCEEYWNKIYGELGVSWTYPDEDS